MVNDSALNEVPAFLEDSLLFSNDIMECSGIEEVEHFPLEDQGPISCDASQPEGITMRTRNGPCNLTTGP